MGKRIQATLLVTPTCVSSGPLVTHIRLSSGCLLVPIVPKQLSVSFFSLALKMCGTRLDAIPRTWGRSLLTKNSFICAQGSVPASLSWPGCCCPYPAWKQGGELAVEPAEPGP